MITETKDPTFFNEVSNHPKVRQWIAPPSYEGEIDVRPLFKRGAIGLLTDHGGFMLTPCRVIGEYEGHAFFLPQEDRAARALADTKEALAYSFDKLGVRWLSMDVPVSSAGVRQLLSATGFVMDDQTFEKHGLEVVTYSLWPRRFAAIMQPKSS